MILKNIFTGDINSYFHSLRTYNVRRTIYMYIMPIQVIAINTPVLT